MKKNSIARRSPKRAAAREEGPITIGMDLGDRASRYCVLGGKEGDRLLEGSVATNKKAMLQRFARMRRCRVAMEVGTHSPWVSRLLSSLGFEVIVANARQVQLISASSRKNDRMDARLLARLARVDPQLLRPIRHRSEQGQADLMTIRVRATLVEARTGLVNAARGFAKAMGERLPACDADAMGVEKMEMLPEQLRERLRPLLEQVESLTEQIKKLDTDLRADRPDPISGNRTPAAGERSGDFDRSDICVDGGGSGALPEEPGRGLLRGPAAQAERIGAEPAAVVDQQGRRPVFADVAGAGSASNSEPARSGHGSEAVGAEAGRTRRQECQEASDRGGGAEAGGVAAPVVGDRRSVRAVAQQPCGTVVPAGGLKEFGFVANRRVRVTARSRRNERFRKGGDSVRF